MAEGGGKKDVAALRGISHSVLKSLKRRTKEKDQQRSPRPSRRSSVFVQRPGRGSTRSSLLASKSVISTIATLLDLEEFEFPEEGDLTEAAQIEAKLDVTALDRYNEDVRRIRKLAIEECRALPQKGDPDEHVLRKVKLTVRALCRTAFYGTHKAIVLAEGAALLITWLLNRRNIKTGIKVHVLQSLAEMMWTSLYLKLALYKCRGVRVLAKLLVNGVKQKSDQARWACYTLAMCCISSTEAISAVQEIDRIDEIVGEVAFYAYWVNWPANFGSILQGILFGPHSVITMEDTFDFI